MAATPDQVKQAMENYIKAWATNDKDLFLSLFADDATWEDPVGTPPFIGKEGVTKFWDFAHQGEERSLNPEITQMIACGNEGILRFTMKVRLPEKNQGLDLHAVDHFVLNDQGKVQQARAFWDEHCLKAPEGMEMFIPDISDIHGS